MDRILESGVRDGLEITVVRNRQELGSIMEAWEELQKAEESPVPEVDPYLYTYKMQSFGPDAEPYIVCLRRDARLETMLIGRYEEVDMPIRLGYLTIVKPRLRKILVYHGGILGRKADDACAILLRTLRDCLNRGEADVAEFNHFHCDSVMYYVIRSKTPLMSLGCLPKIDGHWKMEIPNCMNDFYQRKSHKRRQMLRQAIRRLEKSHKVYMHIYSDGDSLEQGISAAASVSSKTYQHALGGGFLDNLQTRSYLLQVARQGWLRIYILYVNNEAVAFQWGIQYGGTFFLRTIGFDPKWRNWSVGTVLFLKVLQALCEDPNVNHMDFGFGDAEYKNIYGDTRTDTSAINIWADRLYPRLLNFLRTGMVGAWLAASYAVNKLGLERKIKRLWRDRLRREVAREAQGTINAGTGDPDDSGL